MSFNSRSIKTEAVVLKKKDLLDKDVLICLFTEQLGQLTVFAKGIKKITSRRSPHLQTGNLVNVLLSHKNNRYFLQESQLVSGFSELKKNSESVKQLYSFLFVLDRLLPEEQKETKIYNLTKNFLIELSKSSSKAVILGYLTDMMKLMGYLDKKVGQTELKSLIEEIINEKIPLLPL